MKFKLPGKALQTNLQVMGKVLNAKNTISILDNFLLKVEGNRLWITGTDSETTMVTWLEIFEAEGEGEVAVASKTLMEMAREVGNQPLDFVMDDETRHIDVNYMNGHFEFMGIDGSEFPRRAADSEESRELLVPAEVIAKGIDNTLYAVSSDTIRPAMTGIFWDVKEDNITFVSSDTHKLVRYINSQVKPGFEGGFILPSKPAGILRSMIGKEDTEVKMRITSKGAVFEVGNYKMTCKFIIGNYPNYNRVIINDSPYYLTVNREALLTAVRRVSLFASKSTSLVKCMISASSIKMVARDYDYSTLGEETVECNYFGQPMMIGFSTGYMIDILSHLNCEELRINLVDPARPGLFEPLEQQPDENIVVLQMPIQVME
ncbi:MAG: DNA polymerase III subunit beta [Muribaculaceae bacterium]|nr:DNA polymerase III subunit beta [Muribaculaceae bacterium]